MNNHGYMLSIPGSLSRRGVIDVGLRCPSRCLHCFTREPSRASDGKDFERNNKAPWRPTEQLIRQVELMKENGFISFDVTGGEPTLHPGIVDIIARATEIGLASRIITLGQFLDRNSLLDRLFEAGLTDMRFSYHAADKKLFREMTGGDLDKIESAMTRLDMASFEYYTNTTVTSANFKTLPYIARSIIKHRIYHADFLCMMSHYEWAEEADREIRARYTEVAPYLREARDICEDAGIAVGVRYAPLCTVPGMEKNYVGQVGVRHDPHEWMNTVEHTGPGDAERESQRIPMAPNQPAPGAWLLGHTEKGPFVGRGSREGISKMFGRLCQSCSAIRVCDGVDESYLRKHSDEELIPHVFDDRGGILDRDRLGYLAGHVVKLKQDGKPSRAVRRLLHPTPVGKEPLVSFVVPNYNHAGELVRCLDSIWNQTYKNFELIIVDDCSTDDSVKVIEDWRENVLKGGVMPPYLLVLPLNAGRPSVPRNAGLSRTHGQILCCLDADDWILPTYAEEAVRLFQKHPEASIVYPASLTFGMEEVLCAAPPFNAEVETRQNFIGSFSMFRREVYEDVGGFDEDPELKGVEDYLMWISAVRLGHYGVPLVRPLVRYSRSETGLFESVVKPNSEAKHRLVFEKNSEIYSSEFLEQIRKSSDKKADPEMSG